MTRSISNVVPTATSRRTVSFLGLLACLCFSALFTSAQTLPNDPQLSGAANCNVATTQFNSFFHSGTAAVDGVVDPANSVAFPNNTLLKNCDFYQWAQQMFLWLTSPAPPSYGGGGGRIFASPQFFTVSPADVNGKRTLISNSPGRLRFINVRAAQFGAHGLPVIMSKSGQMFEVQPGPISKAGKPLVRNRAGQQVEVSEAKLQNGRLVLLDKAGKAITAPKLIVPKQIPLEQIQRLRLQPPPPVEPLPQHEIVEMRPSAAHVQALMRMLVQPVNPKLIAQRFMINGRNIFLNVNGGVIETEEGQADFPPSALVTQNGSLIYYVTMVNDVMAYFLTGTKDGGIHPTPTQFPTTGGDRDTIVAFASMHGKTFPDPNALAIEVKSAWIEASNLANPSQYITTQAVIPTFDTTTNPNQWTPNGQKTTTLALVGMHVVGSANGHPEMIWATFEHFGNDPDASFNYNSTTSGANHNVPQVNPVAGTWLFTATGATAPFNIVHAQLSSGNIVGFPAGNAVVASNILRFKPYGAALGIQPNPLIPDDATSNTQVIGIDDSIQSDFAALPGGPDIRTNYYMRGATWTENGAIPNGSFPTGTDVGTSQLANTTMETFQQTTTSFNAFSNNCFSCHQTNKLNVSHMACDPLQSGCVAGIQPLF
jgi:hypothetical protein